MTLLLLLLAGCAGRKLVKLRAPALAAQYQQVTATVSEILALGCQLQPQLPADIPKDQALEAEKRVVTLQGYLMAVRFERFGPFQDRDLHLQLSDSPDWRTGRHIIAEVPPGATYGAASKAIWQLVKNEDPAAGRTHIFRNPPRVTITGFLFFDSSHARREDCTSPGGRGIRDAGHPNMVQGVWELHPVIAVRSE